MRLAIMFFLFLHISCGAQQVTLDRVVGGPCEGCEALLEYGNRSLVSIDTISGYHENNPKLLVSGTIYENDGVTPAYFVMVGTDGTVLTSQLQ